MIRVSIPLQLRQASRVSEPRLIMSEWQVVRDVTLNKLPLIRILYPVMGVCDVAATLVAIRSILRGRSS